MTEQEIIAKAKKALDALQIKYENDDIEVSNNDNVDELLDMLEMEEEEKKEFKSKYSISFKDMLPNGQFTSIFVKVDVKTHKLLYVLTNHDQIPIPDELK